MPNRKIMLYLDTNALMLPGRHKVDIFTQAEDMMQAPFEFVVLDKTLDELRKLSLEAKKKADRDAAKLAILLIKQKSLKIARSFGARYADDALVRKAKPHDYVMTQDKELKKRLRNKGVTCIGLRQKSRIR